MLAIGRGPDDRPQAHAAGRALGRHHAGGVNQIADILVAINRNEQMTLVVVEQNVPMLFRMTDRFIILEKGQIVAAGSREQVAASEVIRVRRSSRAGSAQEARRQQ